MKPSPAHPRVLSALRRLGMAVNSARWLAVSGEGDAAEVADLIEARAAVLVEQLRNVGPRP